MAHSMLVDHHSTLIAETMFMNCEVRKLCRGTEFKKWFGVDKKTYLRVLGLFEIPLSQIVTAAEKRYVKRHSTRHTKEGQLIMARIRVQEMIYTDNGQPKHSWTPERCFQMMLMFYGVCFDDHNAKCLGFSQWAHLKESLTLILISVLKSHFPITVNIISETISLVHCLILNR